MNKTKKNRIALNFYKVIFAVAIFSFANLVYASEITVLGVVESVNESREAQGLIPLVQDDILTKVAQDKLNDMIENNYFAHTSPKNVTPWFWFEKNNYNYQFAGENLAINFESIEEQHKAWMNSPTHRKNILNSDYQEIGVAFGAGEIGGQMSLITVQEFGKKMGVLQTQEKEKKFLGNEDRSLIEKGNKIVPQVLAIRNDFVKKMISEDYLKKKQNDFWSKILSEFNQGKSMVVAYGTVASIFVLLLVVAIIPVVLWAIFFKKNTVLYEKEKQNNEIEDGHKIFDINIRPKPG